MNSLAVEESDDPEVIDIVADCHPMDEPYESSDKGDDDYDVENDEDEDSSDDESPSEIEERKNLEEKIEAQLKSRRAIEEEEVGSSNNSSMSAGRVRAKW